MNAAIISSSSSPRGALLFIRVQLGVAQAPLFLSALLQQEIAPLLLPLLLLPMLAAPNHAAPLLLAALLLGNAGVGLGFCRLEFGDEDGEFGVDVATETAPDQRPAQQRAGGDDEV